jgi:tetratricopeptide (TPR) repeat protein
MMRSIVLTGLAVLVVAPLLAQEGSWVGKKIMPTKAGIKMASAADKSKSEGVGELRFTDHTVLADQGGRLKVIQQGVEGWFDKNDAVLLADAVPYFSKKVEADPKDGDALHARGVAHILKGEYESAIKDLSEAIRLNPKSAESWNSRGTAHRLKKDYGKAIADCTEAVRLNPKYTDAYNSRGVAHAKKKDYDKALTDFNEAMRINPKDAVGCNSAAWLLSVCPDEKYRNGKKGVELATKACELTHWKRQGYIDTLAAAYAETGDFDKAVKYQELALEDAGYQQRHGAWASKVLEGYKNKKPYRED